MSRNKGLNRYRSFIENGKIRRQSGAGGGAAIDCVAKVRWADSWKKSILPLRLVPFSSQFHGKAERAFIK
jgi:hypothetical protein